MMKPEEFGKWLESWLKERQIPTTSKQEGKIIEIVPDTPYNPYDDMEWLTRSWGLIR
jgi:hypothetical protein